jgi:hypothetical protein
MLILFTSVVFCVYKIVSAATIHTFSDRLSTSAPNQSSNHTITFTTNVPIPANGFIRFTPDAGDFTIPAVNFDVDNVALYVATSSGFILRAATGTPSASSDGVAITTGTSGNIEVTLNSSVSIPANAQVQLLIGSHTPRATSTDVGITNPTSTGNFAYDIDVGDGVTNTHVQGRYAIIDQVTIADVDTREINPPVRFNGAPTGDLSGTTVLVEMSLETDEFARCRYSTASGTPYFSMGNEFSNGFTAIHSKLITVASDTPYTYFVRCIDDEGNVNIDDYEISFTVLPYPEGTPGDEGDDQGEGSGTGDGSGDSDPGDGSPTGGGSNSGGSASGGGSGGGGGGGSGSSSGGSAGGGGFEGENAPYQSGDGQVIIKGYAFPRSTITILVDGIIADTVLSDATGAFDVTLDAIARGAYTFGVYGTDRNGTKSSTFSTTFTVTGARGSTLSNINVMPSIKVTPDPAQPDSTLKISGYAIPNAVVTIENQSDKSSANLKTFTALSDANGIWTYDMSTAGFKKGTYKVRAKAKQETVGGVSTNFSSYTFYGVGEAASVPRSSDLNRDGKVNLIDFSILLFWWNTDGGTSNPPADINGDGRVSLTDFSILIFNWTG